MSQKAQSRARGVSIALAAAAFFGLTAAAVAQDAGQPPVLPPQPGTGVPEKIDPPLGSAPGEDTTGTLSQKLNRSEGVIQPPAGVDPAIRMAPPQTGGNMPVITPPGEPGGNPTVQPK